MRKRDGVGVEKYREMLARKRAANRSFYARYAVPPTVQYEVVSVHNPTRTFFVR